MKLESALFRITRSARLFALSIFAAAIAVSVVAPTTAQRRPGHGVTVMTRNLYFGTSLNGVMTSTNLLQVMSEVDKAFKAVHATNFPERAEALAREIVRARPQLIGLQEAALWRIQSPGDILKGGTKPATKVVFDFVQILLAELAERGARYEVAVSIDELDAELPSITGDDIRLTDRDVILVRKRSWRSHVRVLRTDSGHFNTLLRIPVGGTGGPIITVNRGWVAADVLVGWRFFRFLNTHLEDDVAPPIQEAQARELLAGPAAVRWPVIAVGDFNSNASGPGTQSYQILLTGGFADAWTRSGRSKPGFTWGQDPDLRNAKSKLSQRLDLVLYRGRLKATRAHVVGDKVRDKTSTGMWPSDHAGVVAKFRTRR